MGNTNAYKSTADPAQRFDLGFNPGKLENERFALKPKGRETSR
jgi:hypothetical protein